MSTPGNVITVTIRDDDAGLEYDADVEYTRIGRRFVVESVELVKATLYLCKQGIKADAISQLKHHDRLTCGNVLYERFPDQVDKQVEEYIDLEETFGAETEAERRWEAATGR